LWLKVGSEHMSRGRRRGARPAGEIRLSPKTKIVFLHELHILFLVTPLHS